MKQFIIQKEWLALPKDVRQSLIYTFSINKSEGVRVVAGEIVSDGCSGEDLISGLTIGKMIEFLGSDWEKAENDALFDHLLENVINKLTKKNENSKSDVKNEVKEQVNKGAETGAITSGTSTEKGSRRAGGKGKVAQSKG